MSKHYIFANDWSHVQAISNSPALLKDYARSTVLEAATVLSQRRFPNLLRLFRIDVFTVPIVHIEVWVSGPFPPGAEVRWDACTPEYAAKNMVHGKRYDANLFDCCSLEYVPRIGYTDVLFPVVRYTTPETTTTITQLEPGTDDHTP